MRAAVLAELRGRGRWLLVFDNAETPADVTRWLPGGGGHVLITSRERGWAEVAVPVEVDVLSRPESVTILQHRVAGLTEADADRLAAQLGDLPLAITQAAAFMTSTGMPADQYVGLLRTRAGRLLDQGTPGSYPRSLAAATQLTADRLARDDPAAAELASVCAFLAPDPIPEDLFTGAVGILPGDLASRAAVPLAWRQAAGLPDRAVAGPYRSPRTADAPAIQAILRDRLTPGQATTTRGCAEAVLVAGKPRRPAGSGHLAQVGAADAAYPGRRPGCRRQPRAAPAGAGSVLVPRSAATPGPRMIWPPICTSSGASGWATITGRCWGMAHYRAWALQEMWHYAEARDLDQDVLDRIRRVLGEDHPSHPDLR